MAPRVLTPREWGAQIDYLEWDDPFTPDDGVALHHGGNANYPAGRLPVSLANEIAQMRSWENYHLNKGWRGIGYGFGVGQTGTILIGREFNSYGAHSGDVDGDGIANNTEVVPVIWIASGNYHKMTDEAKESISYLRREIILPRSPKARYLYGHQELKGIVTSCPGPEGMAYVRANRVEDTMLTAQQKNAVNWLVNVLASKADDDPPWGGWFWEKYVKLWRGSPPAPLHPVTHVQLGFVWQELDKAYRQNQAEMESLSQELSDLKTLIEQIEQGGSGADSAARKMLAGIHQATSPD